MQLQAQPQPDDTTGSLASFVECGGGNAAYDAHRCASTTLFFGGAGKIWCIATGFQTRFHVINHLQA